MQLHYSISSTLCSTVKSTGSLNEQGTRSECGSKMNDLPVLSCWPIGNFKKGVQMGQGRRQKTPALVAFSLRHLTNLPSWQFLTHPSIQPALHMGGRGQERTSPSCGSHLRLADSTYSFHCTGAEIMFSATHCSNKLQSPLSQLECASCTFWSTWLTSQQACVAWFNICVPADWPEQNPPLHSCCKGYFNYVIEQVYALAIDRSEPRALGA